MWRTSEERTASAVRRLGLAFELWKWTPHEKQRLLFTSPSQVTVAACGRRWGKTECLGMDIATLALDELREGPVRGQLTKRNRSYATALPQGFRAGFQGLGVERVFSSSFERRAN